MAEVTRSIEYDGETPLLVIRRKIDPQGCIPFAIRVNDLWQYSYDHNENFDRNMYWLCSAIMDRFGLGIVTSQKMAEIATVIEDGIDDLLKAPPKQRIVDAALRDALAAAADSAVFDGKTVHMDIVVQ